jgi:colicin import membrane protein
MYRVFIMTFAMLAIAGCQTPSLGEPAGNLPRVSQGELEQVFAKLKAHWNLPRSIASQPDLYVVRVRVRLGRDGRLSSPPEVVSRGSGPLYQVASEAAKRAVELSQPFDMLPPSTYEAWKVMEISFDPREMMKRH